MNKKFALSAILACAALTFAGDGLGAQAGTPMGKLTIVKDAQPNDAQDFTFTPNVPTIPQFLLDDDASGPLLNSKTFTIPAGSYTFTETQVSGWVLVSITCTPGAGTTTNVATRSATIVLAAGGNVTCTFVNKRTTAPLVQFRIRKNTGPTQIPGTYLFTVACTGAGGPYTGPPVAVAFPNPGMGTINVPSGSICTITETQPPGSWSPPVFTGSGIAVTPGAPWQAQVGPLAASGGTVTVANRPKTTSSDCPNPSQNTIGCRVTVTVKRTKGPAVYSVLVSPTSPMPNVVAPSTPASCVIAGMATPQTTCWFNYSTNGQFVTLTATSSTGVGTPPLPPTGFYWSGACASFGSTPICTVSATLSNPPIVTANFP